MGWFSIGNDDTIGDLPADTIQWALQEYAREAMQKPTIYEVLQGLETVLHDNEQNYLDRATADRWPIGQLTLRGQAPAVSPSDLLPSSLIETLQGTLEGIVQAYEISLSRKPRLTEILACFTFALQGDLSPVLRNAEDLSLTKGDLTELR